MKKSDIIERLENMSVFFSSIEQEVKNLNSQLQRIKDELELIKEYLGECYAGKGNS